MNTARYTRQTQLADFGTEGQQKLLMAKVLVVGAGGLGVPVLQYLTGMGVGTIGIVDGDQIDLSNLHRQVLYTAEEVGQLKASTAATRLAKLNPEVKLTAIPYFLSRDNALDLIKDYDLVIDASDNFATRYLINDACVILNKPFIYGALQQYEGHVSVFNFESGPTYRCLYPAPPAAAEIPDCNTAGVLGIIPGIIGSQQALQAIKVLTGIGQTLSGFLQIIDLKTDDQYKIKLKADSKNKQITQLQSNYDVPVCATTGIIEVEELYQWYTEEKPFYLIDVREPKEFKEEYLEFAHNVPLSMLKDNLKDLPQNIQLITICQIGGRSQKAAQMISEVYPNRPVYNVAGGMDAWFDELGDQLVIEPQNINRLQ